MAGYIKLYRELLDHPVVHKDNDYLAVWIYILTHAKFEPAKADFNGVTITLDPGQFITGRKVISQKCGVSESKVDRILNRFESEQQIEQRKTPNKRLISVLNWMSYQQSEQQSEQRLNNDWTTTEQRLDTIKKDKNYKKEKNEKNNTKNIGVFAQYSGDNLALLKALDDFESMRKAIKKPMTDRAKELLCHKLSKMSGDPIDILNQSIVKNWSDVYPLKETQRVEPIPDYTPTETSSVDVNALKERLRKI